CASRIKKIPMTRADEEPFAKRCQELAQRGLKLKAEVDGARQKEVTEGAGGLLATDMEARVQQLEQDYKKFEVELKALGPGQDEAGAREWKQRLEKVEPQIGKALTQNHKDTHLLVKAFNEAKKLAEVQDFGRANSLLNAAVSTAQKILEDGNK